jgi:hypothetical protein
LFLDDGEIERTICMKRRVSGSDQSSEFCFQFERRKANGFQEKVKRSSIGSVLVGTVRCAVSVACSDATQIGSTVPRNFRPLRADVTPQRSVPTCRRAISIGTTP